jgi:hypothetical protein
MEKTHIARTISASIRSSSLVINGPELSSAYHGETVSPNYTPCSKQLTGGALAFSYWTKWTFWHREEMMAVLA